MGDAESVCADDLELDLSDWAPLPPPSDLLLRAGVVLRRRLVAQPPDLPASLSQPDVIRESIAGAVSASGAALVDLEVLEVGGARWLRTVAKRRGEGRGMVYLGSLQVHFASCWWLVQMEARERGVTGAREVMVLLMRGQPGDLDRSGYAPVSVTNGQSLPGPDPSLPVLRGPWDDPEWDKALPDHPLSLVRAAQRDLLATARISPRALALPPFLGSSTRS